MDCARTIQLGSTRTGGVWFSWVRWPSTSRGRDREGWNRSRTNYCASLLSTLRVVFPGLGVPRAAPNKSTSAIGAAGDTPIAALVRVWTRVARAAYHRYRFPSKKRSPCSSIRRGTSPITSVCRAADHHPTPRFVGSNGKDW